MMTTATDKATARPWSAHKVTEQYVHIVDAGGVVVAEMVEAGRARLIVQAVNHFEEMRALMQRMAGADGDTTYRAFQAEADAARSLLAKLEAARD